MSPLLFVTASFCLGISAAFFVHLPWAVVFAAVVILLAAVAACGAMARAGDTVIVLVALLLGVCCSAAHQLPSAASIDSVGGSRRISVRGIVAGISEGAGAVRIFLAVEEIMCGSGSRAGNGKIVVLLRRGTADIDPGDRIVVTGELLPSACAFPSSRKGYVRYLANHGMTRVLVCNPWEIAREQYHAAGKLPRLLDSFKERFFRVLDSRLSSQSAVLMRAMILGEKKGISPLISKAMINSGTIHILVVSGFNVGIVVCLIAALLKLVCVPRKARFFVLLPCIIFYCLLTGASEPVVRAGIMAAIMSAAILAGRDGDIQHAFALTLCVMVFLNPRLLCDASFQLSFASVFSLILVYPALKSLLAIGQLKLSAVRFFADGLAVSFSAWLGTVGIVAYYFHIISPWAIVINVLAAPLAGFITLCGFSLVAADKVVPVVAGFIAVTADYAIALLVHIVSLKCFVLSFN